MPPVIYDDDDDSELENKSICKKMFGGLCPTDKIKTVISEDNGHTPIDQIIKILVVGPGDSGKSTILKQMRVIHGKSYSTEEYKKYKPIIIQNVIDSMIRLIDAMNLFSLDFEIKSNESHYDELMVCYEHVKSGDLTDWNRNSIKYSNIINSLWKDSSIKICYQRRNLFYLNDSTEFFMINLNRICSPEYIPILDDILRVRQPTTAIQEYKFKISGTYFLFVDVGGQRSERRKWINCFENVTCLLFVASLSDYDLKMSKDELKSSNSSENEDVNRMRDGLDLFRTLINWKKKVYTRPDRNSVQEFTEKLLFENVTIILFLNKEDLFEEKFRRSSLKTCFVDYVETDSSEKAKEFIAHKFIECDYVSRSTNKPRDIYWHYTYALDKKCIETVVASVKDRILKMILETLRF